MNVTPTSNNQLPGAAAQDESAVAGATPGAASDPLLAPVQDGAAPFAQWLAQALPELLAEGEPVDAPDAGAAAADDTPSDDAAAGNDAAQAQPAAPDMPLLAAMAAPLIAPGCAPLPTGAPGAAPTPAPTAAPAPGGITAITGAQGAGGDDLLAALTRATVPAPRSAASGQAEDAAGPASGAQHAQGMDDAASVRAAPLAATAEAPASTTAAQTRLAGASPAGNPANAPADPAADGAPANVAAATWAAPAAAAPASTNAAAPVVLAGPPVAWRQTLHNALGERLQMQAGGNVEQAVIRLEPPNLGRIDIAIRHSAGALEVSLSATHTEVVRQLQAVTDNLRNDLASRQYSEVSVTVAQAAPRAQAGASNPFADQQGRGRQPSREQEQSAPGMALAENSNPDTSFSLNGRA